ncbi:hypothetical protein [Marinilactibacillus sp. Marseille-P9653]|uniref:hypothetical protein n=1 Tax=Marinilactibacillus sp. Marseille-P9653 TaxID=2866583 RepID=UPI001CE3FA99|nr:hypothetical protein [Marinilactibacillus sp. Marseille-P9653]
MDYIIEEKLINELDNILKKYKDTDSLEFWREYYDFIVLSYNHKNRYGLSSLARVLKKNNVKNDKQLIEIYGRGLLIIARNEGEKIYGEYFNP